MNAADSIHGTDRTLKPLTLSRSEVIKGAELYEGNLVDKFDTGWHFHDGWQIVAVTEGARRYQFKSGMLVASPGRLVLLPPNLVHRAECAKRGANSFQIATLPTIHLNGMADSVPVQVLDTKLFDQFLSTYRSLQSGETRESGPEILAHLKKIISVRAVRTHNEELRAPAFVAETRRHLSESLSKVPSLASLSVRVGVSPYHLAHAFTKFVGLSPLAYHARARLLKSRTLLSEGKNLIDVALSLGFADQSHFGRHFKNVYAMTPKEYRRSVTSLPL